MIRLFSLFLFFTVTFSCKSVPKEAPADVSTVPESLADKLMIELKMDVDPDLFAESYAKYALRKKYIASKSKNMHMFVFDTKTISIGELIKKLSKNRKVVSVEALSNKLKDPTGNISEKKKTVDIK